MSFSPVPKPGQKSPGPAVPESPRSNARRLGAFPWLVLGAAVTTMGLLVAMLRALDATPSKGSNPSKDVRAPVAPPETPREIERRDRVAPRVPTLVHDPRDVVPVAATSDAEGKQAPAEWPAARAFTARCKAPGGGCVEHCTTLAGGRCLDPCFIHTAECSNDCKQPDGTCGWPPPDSE